MAIKILLLALVSLAFALVSLSYGYRRCRPRPLPRHSPWFQWFPKYSFEIPITAALDDRRAVGWELSDWLAAWGFDSCEDGWEDRLAAGAQPVDALADATETSDWVFQRNGSWSDITDLSGMIRVAIARPVTDPAQVVISYRSGVVFDTGDLARFGRELLDKEESASGTLEDDGPTESGNPYQTPRL